MKSFPKDPDAILDYSVDWSEWLGGDLIDTSTWIVPPTLAMTDSTVLDGVTTVWIRGGTAGRSYKVCNHITTAGGRTDDRSFMLQVDDR